MRPLEFPPQVENMLHVPPVPPHLGELPVAKRDVFGRECGIGGAQEISAVEPLLDLKRLRVCAQDSTRSRVQVAGRAGLGGDDPSDPLECTASIRAGATSCACPSGDWGQRARPHLEDPAGRQKIAAVLAREGGLLPGDIRQVNAVRAAPSPSLCGGSRCPRREGADRPAAPPSRSGNPRS